MKKSEKTEITVFKIIEAAMNEFGKNGYTGGTVNNICKAGINKGLLYHNFAGKNELYLTCLNRSCKKLMQYIQKRNGTKNLESYMAARMDFFNEYPNEAHIFFEALLNPLEPLQSFPLLLELSLPLQKCRFTLHLSLAELPSPPHQPQLYPL